jgi:2-polyprenyl-3-methyl-5-hydroxy-6-metoxy-1,4-benzoquinol methylase
MFYPKMKETMVFENSTSLSDLNSFFNLASQFKAKLNEAKSFDEIRRLWLETSIPYELNGFSPYSDAYRDIQLAIYKKLAQDTYSVNNELTSVKLSSEQFDIGYPWTSKNLGVIGSHFGKIAQALAAIGEVKPQKEVLEVIEFGAGWGELAIPLAKSGQNVTCVDIDDGFIQRIKRIAAKEGCQLSTINGDFVEAARGISAKNFDCAVFQSSFHHCLDFNGLVAAIKKNVLNENGVILFLAEPIFKNYNFPWGLRFDGESLWAIMINSWLELGFDYDFFSDLMLKNGFFLTTIAAIGNLIGDGYMAKQSNGGIDLQDWALAATFRDTWHIDSAKGVASFSKKQSVLPGLKGTMLVNKRYRLAVQNYSPADMSIKIVVGDTVFQKELPSGAPQSIEFVADCEIVLFEVSTFIPDESLHNGDTRELGFAITSVIAN